MEKALASKSIRAKNGTITCNGQRFIIVCRRPLRNTRTGERLINGVSENAVETDPGYFPMTLLHITDDWKAGNPAFACEPNGEYDWIMREQLGVLTPQMTYNEGPCHED